ncbi:hypothetical protein [Flavisolibacter tropicus]|nr:hypothetical protein [Flavisolibacter tropicus]
MENIITFDTVSQYNTSNNHETLHPLITVIDYSKVLPRQRYSANFGL